MRIQRGKGSPYPPKNHKHIGFPSSAGLDSLKNQGSLQCWAIIDQPAKCNFNGVSLGSQWWPAFSNIWIPTHLKKEKNLSKLSWTPLINLAGSAHVHYKSRTIRANPPPPPKKKNTTKTNGSILGKITAKQIMDTKYCITNMDKTLNPPWQRDLQYTMNQQQQNPRLWVGSSPKPKLFYLLNL